MHGPINLRFFWLVFSIKTRGNLSWKFWAFSHSSRGCTCKTWRKFTKSSPRTDKLSSKRLPTGETSNIKQVSKFSGRSYTCSSSPASFCLSCSPTYRGSCKCLCARNCFDRAKMTQLLLKDHNKSQNLVLLLRPTNQTAVLLVEKPVLSTSQESEASQVSHHGYVGDLQLPGHH